MAEKPMVFNDLESLYQL